VLVSHGFNLIDLEGLYLSSQGEAAIYLPEGNGYRLVARLQPADWAALAAAGRRIGAAAAAGAIIALQSASVRTVMRSHHDMGGLPAGRVEATEHDYALWEKRVDALLVLLTGAKQMTVDELRKNIEAIGPDAYDRMTYYERWIHSISQTLLQRGVITIDELGRRMSEVEARHRDGCR
jgi:hypothetical protein